MNLELKDLAQEAFLSTKTGKKVHIVAYEPPGVDRLGAKLYFPRRLPDESDLVTPMDNELRFETRVEGQKIEAKFDLRKLAYKGRLET
jgi:hypothetical protein